MNIRSMFSSVLVVAVAPLCSAKDLPAPAELMYAKGGKDRVLITDYGKGSLIYKLTANDINRTKIALSKVDSVYFLEPQIYSEAINLYQGRKYKEAKEKFAQCELTYRKVDTAPNNFASLAGFYKLECSRRMFDLKALSEEQEKFRKDGLTREVHIQQLEVNAFWEAVRLKDWNRLDRFAKAWRDRKVSGSQRAQIAYCHGVALEQLTKEDPKRISDALNSYNMALSADFTASSEIVMASAQAILRMYTTDPAVKQAMNVWQTEDENKGKAGYQRLIEANKFVKLYQLAGWEATKPLRPEQLKFLEYTESEDPMNVGGDEEEEVEKEEAKPEEKTEVANPAGDDAKSE